MRDWESAEELPTLVPAADPEVLHLWLYRQGEEKRTFLERRTRNGAHDVVLPGFEHPAAPLGSPSSESGTQSLSQHLTLVWSCS